MAASTLRHPCLPIRIGASRHLRFVVYFLRSGSREVPRLEKTTLNTQHPSRNRIAFPAHKSCRLAGAMFTLPHALSHPSCPYITPA